MFPASIIFRQQGLLDGDEIMHTCPKFETFMKPMLMLASKGEVNVRESADVIANDLGLTS